MKKNFPATYLQISSRMRNVIILMIVVLAALVGLLHVFITTEISPDHFGDGSSSTCQQQSKIAFLKTHKCASSTIQNILLRYSDKYDHVFALPQKGHYFGGGTIPLTDAILKTRFRPDLDIDILAVHTRWNISNVRNFMGNDALLITIIRKPQDRFVSMYTYYNLEHKTGMTMERAIKSADHKKHRRYTDKIGFNQMAFDFGMEPSKFDDETAINELIHQMEESFDLVMVAERMQESLMLLRELMCTPMEDVAVLKLNSRKSDSKLALDQNLMSILNTKQNTDNIIYQHFLTKFDKLVRSYGEKRMAKDIKEYNRITEDNSKRCGFHKVPGKQLNLFGNGVFGYKSTSKDWDCVSLARDELAYIKLMRNKLNKKQNEKTRD